MRPLLTVVVVVALGCGSEPSTPTGCEDDCGEGGGSSGNGSGSSTGSSGSGSGSSTGNASGSSTGSGIGSPAQGGWVVNFSDTGAACPIPGHGAKIGDISATDGGVGVTEGENGAHVVCDVAASAGSFAVDARATLGANDLRIIIPEIDGTADQGSPATGSVSYASAETAGNQYASESCSFYFATGSAQAAEPGAIWVTFACPSVVNVADDCAIMQSYALFANCAK